MPSELINWLKKYWDSYGFNKKAFFYRCHQYDILEKILLSTGIPFIKSECKSSSKEDFINFINQDNIIGISTLPKENIILGNYKKYSRDDLDIFIFNNYYTSELQSWFSQSHVGVVDCSDEWVAREHQTCHILASDPVKNKAWLRYTKSQRETILKYFANYQNDEHKRLFKIIPK